MNDRPNGRREERGAHSRQERMQSRPAERSERSRRNGKHKNGKVLYYGVLVLLLAVLVFSSVKIISYMMEKKQSERTQQDLIDQVVTPGPDNDDTENPGTENDTPGGSEPDYITVDFKALQAKYPDVVGWLYWRAASTTCTATSTAPATRTARYFWIGSAAPILPARTIWCTATT